MTMQTRIRRLLAAGTMAAFAVACGSDTQAPDAPIVDAPPRAVRDNPWVLTGEGEAGATVEVRGGAEAVASAVVGARGQFTVSVALVADSANLLLVSQTDEAGNESALTKVEVVHDGTPPATPELDFVTTPTRAVKPTLRGKTEADALVRITGGASEVSVEADASGRFEVEVPLNTSLSQQVTNTLVVTAQDLAGNVSDELTVTIVFDANLPVAAPELDPVPSATKEETVTLTGTADAGVGVAVFGGLALANGAADGDGAFSVEVGLRKNTTNVLSVQAVGNGSVSTAVIVEITHDDVPPPTPSLNPMPARTAQTSITVSGQAQPGTTVIVTGGAAEARADTQPIGAFAVEVTLAAGVDNTLSVVARDPAGNDSEPVEVMVRQDETTPEPPKLDAIATPTSELAITVTGSAAADVEVTVSGGAAPVTVTAGEDGRFSASVTLNENTLNELRVSRADTDAETVVLVVHDDLAPSKPSLAPQPSPTNRTTIKVAGTTEASARVVVTGATATASGFADGDGRFSVSVKLASDTATTLSVTAQDLAGNVSDATTVTVVHSSEVGDAPVLDTPNPAPVQALEWTVTGRITSPSAGMQVVIEGASAKATGPIDPQTGAFAIEVTLNANTPNDLSVVSLNGNIESPAALVTVVHDDIAPEAALAEKLSVAASRSCLIIRPQLAVSGSQGAVEAGTRVQVTNTTRSGSAEVRADDAGAFSTSVAACAGEKLSVVVVDDAGNRSEATELTVE